METPSIRVLPCWGILKYNKFNSIQFNNIEHIEETKKSFSSKMQFWPNSHALKIYNEHSTDENLHVKTITCTVLSLLCLQILSAGYVLQG